MNPKYRRELQYGAGRLAVGEQEVSLAVRLIQDRTVRFDPLNYFDRYRDGVQALARSAIASGQLTKTNGEDASNLLQMLEESLRTTGRKTSAAENVGNLL